MRHAASIWLISMSIRHFGGRGLLARSLRPSPQKVATAGASFVWWVRLATNTAAHDFYTSLGVNAVPMVAYAATEFSIFEQLADAAPPVER